LRPKVAGTGLGALFPVWDTTSAAPSPQPYETSISKLHHVQHSFLASRIHVISLTASGCGHAACSRRQADIGGRRDAHRICVHCCYTWSGELHTTICSFGPLYPIAKANCRATPGRLTLFSHTGWLPVLARIRPEDSSFASRDPHASLSNGFKIRLRASGALNKLVRSIAAQSLLRCLLPTHGKQRRNAGAMAWCSHWAALIHACCTST
jgi:hypothetical protein